VRIARFYQLFVVEVEREPLVVERVPHQEIRDALPVARLVTANSFAHLRGAPPVAASRCKALRAARRLRCGSAMRKHNRLWIGIVASTLAAGCAGSITDGDGDQTLSEANLSSNEHTAYNFFVSRGLTKDQSAGIVGNLIQESNVNPTIAQFGGGPGRGIAQWSVGGRWDSGADSVAHYAAAHGVSRWALGTQLDFIMFELENYGYGYSQLRGDTSVTSATITFQDRYEICGTCDSSQRIRYAEEVLSQFGGGSSGGGAGCYSHTLGREMPDNACVQSRFDNLWYQCANGAWVDRWTDPAPCNGVHPL
jgi:hypothetical protein